MDAIKKLLVPKYATGSSQVALSGTKTLEGSMKGNESRMDKTEMLVIPGNRIFPTVAETAGHLTASVLPFTDEKFKPGTQKFR